MTIFFNYFVCKDIIPIFEILEVLLKKYLKWVFFKKIIVNDGTTSNIYII